MKKLILLITAILLVMNTGCAVRQPAKPYEKQIRPSHKEEVKSQEKNPSRSQASRKYTEKGYKELKNGDTDEAISTLERAVSINPRDGKAYYHLAEAWLIKKDQRRAAQYNKLAIIHLKGDSNWSTKAETQKKKISEARP